MTVDYMKNIDCLIGMKDIPDKSIDMVCADLPYGIIIINGMLLFRWLNFGKELTESSKTQALLYCLRAECLLLI